MANRYSNTYTSFAGSDVVALFNDREVGTLSGISWSVTREKAAVYTMGSANVRSFSRGKRGIAGTLQFKVFDRDVLWQLTRQNDDMYIYKRVSEWVNEVYNEPTQLVSPWWEQTVDVKRGRPFYSDEIPPFDITISYANEYGAMARKDILGVEILNEGSGVSMDEILIEEQMTFVARAISKIDPYTKWVIKGDAGTVNSPDIAPDSPFGAAIP